MKMASELYEAATELAAEPAGGPRTPDGDEVKLQETVEAALTEARVDRGSRRISGAKLCGRSSQNGRVYLKPAFKEARDLYEGAAVRVDHTEKGGSIGLGETVGVVRNPQVKNSGMYGDITVFAGDLGDRILDMAERAPDVFGASHEASGKVDRNREGNDKIREITDVKGVALVPNPATTNSLFEELRESIEGDAMRDETESWREADMGAVEQALFRGRPYADAATLTAGDGADSVQESDRDGPDLAKVERRLFS